WYIINTVPSPWGYDNQVLYQIYSDASADDYECPTVVTSKKHSSCGQSRFGCWTCTVVKEDKSMSSLIENGKEWMKPLLEYRNKLVEGRNLPENRSKYRRNGQLSVDDEGNPLGSYNANYKAKLLRELLEIQKKVQEERPHINLITNQELIAIQVLWNRDGIFEHNVAEIYRKVYGKEISTNAMKVLGKTERRVLKDICEDDPQYYHLIDQLIS